MHFETTKVSFSNFSSKTKKHCAKKGETLEQNAMKPLRSKCAKNKQKTSKKR